MRVPDITILNAGSIMVLGGGTDAGRTWLQENLDPDAMRWGKGWVVEPRYVEAIINGAREAGLETETP